MRHNAARGLLGDDAQEALVARRLEHMRAGTPYVAERVFPDGTVVEIRGNPMPGGGFVATFTDVTAFRRAQQALEQSNLTLEQRVAQRTRESEAAREEAERANRAKSRFLAAVGHDLLQPINAAHLFTHALAQQLAHPQYRAAVADIDGALTSTEALLAGVLDISRLDAGGLVPRRTRFPIAELFEPLVVEFGVLARGVALRCPTWPAARGSTATRNCCAAYWATSSPTRCATASVGGSCWAAGGSAPCCGSRSGTPARASMPPIARRSSKSSGDWSGRAAAKASAWDSRSPTVSQGCSAIGSRCARGPDAAACSRSRCRRWRRSHDRRRPPRRQPRPCRARACWWSTTMMPCCARCRRCWAVGTSRC